MSVPPPLRRLACHLAGLLLGLLPVLAAAQPLRIVTEELPPYNMTVNGQVTGLGTEVVQAVLKEAGFAGTPIQVMPWARAYDIALNQENVLIYSITRTPQREKRFKWVGVIAPTRWYLFSLSGRTPPVKTLDDARRFQTATVNEDAGEQYLVANGFQIGQNLQSSNRYELNYEKLKGGRVDLWIANELNATYLVRQAGDDPARMVQRTLALTDLGSEGGLDMAFSLKTPDEVVERFRKGLETIRRNGTYESLQRKWL
ncbi:MULTISPECIES: ABC transporter substrate-binding protein [unclassified Rhizobacter]|uniref:substrate-binding periplasmic protein n=1 Tax=unclassified Rhizobacter TaxID=2640088 RepID=UPI000701A67B|nr:MULTISPECIES: transporter substrate-binding domain-containing protein [unclassified Rhizobacter]KQU76913.1 amino acid ABC transporter substrate-binding protein [Rhizobacter sp. Root29]KQV97434.1 amino acid ABC transporter substrate-binding protein [Rhizobacter sp. Root1238]KRB10105.1 amino acid ABC transporter substrate-binding protein [Rhizobacter sp. Root16D2]